MFSVFPAYINISEKGFVKCVFSGKTDLQHDVTVSQTLKYTQHCKCLCLKNMQIFWGYLSRKMASHERKYYMMKGVCMLVCVGMHVRGSRLCDAKRNVCLPVGLSQGESCQTRVRLHVFVRAHLSLPNVLGCKEFQVHDSNVTLLLLLYFCLPRYYTLSHFHLILSTANAVFCPILASVTFHPF